MGGGTGASRHGACLNAGKNENDGDEEEGAQKAVAVHECHLESEGVPPVTASAFALSSWK